MDKDVCLYLCGHSHDLWCDESYRIPQVIVGCIKQSNGVKVGFSIGEFDERKILSQSPLFHGIMIAGEINILNDKAIPILVKKVNEHLKEKVENDRTEIADVEQELAGVKKQIDNIVTAISNGLCQDAFMVKMKELEGRKVQLESKLRSTNARTKWLLSQKSKSNSYSQCSGILSPQGIFQSARNSYKIM